MGFDVNSRITKLLNSAKQRGIFVNLDVNKYQNLINLGCHYCGSNLENENGYCLDRVDSNKGYTITNVVACCKICNRAKSNMDIMEFVNWAFKVHDHTKKVFEMLKNDPREYNLDEEMEIHRLQSQGKPKNRIRHVPK